MMPLLKQGGLMKFMKLMNFLIMKGGPNDAPPIKQGP